MVEIEWTGKPVSKQLNRGGVCASAIANRLGLSRNCRKSAVMMGRVASTGWFRQHNRRSRDP